MFFIHYFSVALMLVVDSDENLYYLSQSNC
jgi:hypothetical protein